MRTLRLLQQDGRLHEYSLSGNAASHGSSASRPQWNRIALAAAHVVSDPRAKVDPWLDAAIDWDATLAYRRYLWEQGFGVAEAMDTAQRGMGLDWPTSLALIERTVTAARDVRGAVVFSGAGTDHMVVDTSTSIDSVIDAYRTQCEAIERVGGRIILMASRALAACARSPDDYVDVYSRVLAGVSQPVILHWLGEMFDPALAGYWLGRSERANDAGHARAMDVCAHVISANRSKIDGIKVSLLDAEKEIALRARLPAAVRMYTGDDFNFAALIGGDTSGHSDALLGIFDAIAPAASAALSALALGNRKRFDEILAPTVPLSRHIFAAPTRFYKTGVVFMAWLNGHQSHFTMVGGQQSARSAVHLCELFRLADQATLFIDPESAAARMRSFLAVNGVE